jgi:hypothetical protein
MEQFFSIQLKKSKTHGKNAITLQNFEEREIYM